MLRRVSPEGRALALREQRRRQRKQLLLAGRIALIAMVVILTLIAADAALGALAPPILAVAALLFLLASAATLWASRDRPIAATSLNATTLAALPGATAAWLERHCPALPAPAASLAVTLSARLHELEPQLARLNAQEPAAHAVRRLLAVELPDLIDRHQSVPARLRGVISDGSQSADAHLFSGLQIVDEEVARMTAQLAQGDLNALATRDRFLEIKYQGDQMLHLPEP